MTHAACGLSLSWRVESLCERVSRGNRIGHIDHCLDFWWLRLPNFFVSCHFSASLALTFCSGSTIAGLLFKKKRKEKKSNSSVQKEGFCRDEYLKWTAFEKRDINYRPCKKSHKRFTHYQWKCVGVLWGNFKKVSCIVNAKWSLTLFLCSA